MAGSSSSMSSEPNKQQGRRKCNLAEDGALVSSMIDLRILGTHNADTGFKSGYLPELEKMLLEKLPNCNLKAKPHIESRLKTLKKEWSIVYDMIFGSHTSGFGWDETRKMVVAEDAVWNAYITSHKDAAPFKVRSFPFFQELSVIYAKDRATGKDAQAAEDILDEINMEDEQEREQGENPLESTDSLNAPSREVGSASSGKKRKNRESNLMPLTEAMHNMAAEMKEAYKILSKSVHSDILQEKLLELSDALDNVDGLNADQRRLAIRKFAKNSNEVLIFFGTKPGQRLGMVLDLIDDKQS